MAQSELLLRPESLVFGLGHTASFNGDGLALGILNFDLEVCRSADVPEHRLQQRGAKVSEASRSRTRGRGMCSRMWDEGMAAKTAAGRPRGRSSGHVLCSRMWNEGVAAKTAARRSSVSVVENYEHASL